MPEAGCADDRVPCCDLDCDVMQMVWQGEIELDQALSAETAANIETNGALWRQTMNRKFSEVGAIEAAVVDVIISGTGIND